MMKKKIERTKRKKSNTITSDLYDCCWYEPPCNQLCCGGICSCWRAAETKWFGFFMVLNKPGGGNFHLSNLEPNFFTIRHSRRSRCHPLFQKSPLSLLWPLSPRTSKWIIPLTTFRPPVTWPRRIGFDHGHAHIRKREENHDQGNPSSHDPR